MADNYSMRSRVFNRLREDILTGKYKKNDELREAAIGEELGVSRTPVREALHQLELVGLVEIIPNRGAYVVGITSADVEDIYMIRARLEGLCARLAAERVSTEQMGEMEEILMLSRFHEEKKHYSQLFELDSRFHEVLFASCGSKILEHVLDDFHHYIQMVRKRSLTVENRAEKATKEHEAIYAAIKSHDGDKADELATLHIMNARKNMKNHNLGNILDKNVLD